MTAGQSGEDRKEWLEEDQTEESPRVYVHGRHMSGKVGG